MLQALRLIVNLLFDFISVKKSVFACVSLINCSVGLGGDGHPIGIGKSERFPCRTSS